MKSVMISITPRWCELIANGQKTIEVRKSRPKLETPFKCYIYCTSVKNLNLQDYVNVHRATGGAVDDWSGKVIGEFVCRHITNIQVLNKGLFTGGYPNGDCTLTVQNSALTAKDIKAYSNGKEWVYGWHISDLVIYDVPRELSEYKINRPPQSWCYVEEVRK